MESTTKGFDWKASQQESVGKHNKKDSIGKGFLLESITKGLLWEAPQRDSIGKPHNRIHIEFEYGSNSTLISTKRIQL